MGHGLPSYQVDTKTISRRISILLNPAAFVASDHGANGVKHLFPPVQPIT